MYRTELHTILLGALECAKWTRSTRDEDNFRQVICSHLYDKISPNNTEIPSTRSGAGDIRIFGRKIELKYANHQKRDKLDTILDDIDLLIESKVEFCIVALRFDSEHKDTHLVRTVELPLLKGRGAVAPIANRASHNYYGPGIFLPACYPQKPKRISVTEAGETKKTNSYILLEQAHNYERSCFLRIGEHNLHVDIIGSQQDGLLTLLYKRADDITFQVCTAAQDIVVPYEPSAIKIGDIERGNVLANPSLPGRKVRILEEDVPRIAI